MEKQACRGLEDRLGPLTYNLANVIQTPGLCKRPPKSKVRARESTSSDSSAEKPLRKNLKMATAKGQVAEQIATTTPLQLLLGMMIVMARVILVAPILQGTNKLVLVKKVNNSVGTSSK